MLNFFFRCCSIWKNTPLLGRTFLPKEKNIWIFSLLRKKSKVFSLGPKEKIFDFFRCYEKNQNFFPLDQRKNFWDFSEQRKKSNIFSFDSREKIFDFFRSNEKSQIFFPLEGRFFLKEGYFFHIELQRLLAQINNFWQLKVSLSWLAFRDFLLVIFSFPCSKCPTSASLKHYRAIIHMLNLNLKILQAKSSNLN